MRMLINIGILFSVLALPQTQMVIAPQTMEVAGTKAKALELTVVSDRKRYKRNDKIRIDVMLTNKDYVKEIFVFGNLGWGYRASLTEIIRDAHGKRISPKIFSDDLTAPIPRNDTTQFVRLVPKHFLGTYFVEEIDQLNLIKPGKYSIMVEYHSPISISDVDQINFFSKEDGRIESNVVWIEVVP